MKTLRKHETSFPNLNVNCILCCISVCFRLALGAARLQASPVPKNVRDLPSWSVQLDSPETAPTVGGWIVGGSGPGVKSSGVGRGLF